MKIVREIPGDVAEENPTRKRWIGVMLALAAVGCMAIAYYFPFEILIIPALAFDLLPAKANYPWYVDVPLSALITTLSTGLCLAFAVPFYWVWAELEGSKHCVLYLRRFRERSSIAVIRRIAERGFGRQFRLLTLDDQTFRPIEVPRLERALSRTLLPGVLAVVLAVFLGGIVLGLVLWLTYSITLSGLGVIGLVLIIGTVMFAGPLVLPLLPVFVNLIASVLVHRRRVRSRSRRVVTDQRSLDDCTSYLRLLASRVRGPAFMEAQASVVSTTGQMWRTVVLALSEQCSAIIVDVSIPTENLSWEILQMREACLPMLFVAEHEAIEVWRLRASSAQATEYEQQVLSALEGQLVLTYAGTSRRDNSRFKRELLKLLSKAVRPPIPRNTPYWSQADRLALRMMLSSFIVYLIVWFLISLAYWGSGPLWPILL